MLWTTSNYFGFLTFTILGLGIAFQIHLAIIVLVTIESYAGATQTVPALHRPCCHPRCDSNSTGADHPASLAGPLWILYELSIIASVFLKKKHDAKAEKLE